ncbi:hypothetical protein OG905_16110 [Streptomyces sp. NBC_00322]|uniref:hypothetical protein n=1 Tax=Streptomyces sp. NBC_00322 TaxID=2975712 RepID=UPI002E2B25CB|nr:hypothetical protein [Streptomyces sp. NBC_00322]
MEWVDRLAVTCWSTEPGNLDWSRTERVLGTALPADFKELRRRFPEWGAFSDHVMVLEAQGDTESVLANHESLLRSVRGSPDNRRMFEPFEILGASDESDGKGLVQWGYSRTVAFLEWQPGRESGIVASGGVVSASFVDRTENGTTQSPAGGAVNAALRSIGVVSGEWPDERSAVGLEMPLTS